VGLTAMMCLVIEQVRQNITRFCSKGLPDVVEYLSNSPIDASSSELT
jgi:hypothetical protein